MGQESWSPPCVFLACVFLGCAPGADIGWRLFLEFSTGKTAALAVSRGEEIRTKCGLLRTRYVRLRDQFSRCENFDLSPQAGRGEESSGTGLDVVIAPCEPEARLDLGDLGAAHGHAMRRWAIEFDHGAVTFLANEGDMRDRHDMAAVHPDEQAGIELRLGLRDRPRAHPLAGAVMNPGIMRVGPDAPHIRRIDKVRAVGTLHRKPGRRRSAGRLTEAAERRRH